MMRTFVSTLIVAAVVVSMCSVAPAASARKVLPKIVGGYKQIENMNDPHIQELGHWAVSEHDMESSVGLVFSKVVSGQEKVVAGKKYKLAIQATKGVTRKSAMYEAVEWEKVNKMRQLLSFKQARTN